MKTCVVIPVYNEAGRIGSLISDIRSRGFDTIVVDDGSSDETSSVALAAGAIVLRHECNQGKGAALVKGFNYAVRGDYEAVIAMDGDGQHLPSDISNFIQHAENFEGDVLVGNRMHDPHNMPWLRLITNKLMSCFISALIRQKIPDTQCGFRLLKRRVIKDLNLVTANYEIESEMLIKAGRLGYKIRSVPIRSVYGGEKSYINPFRDTVRFFRYICAELFTKAKKE